MSRRLPPEKTGRGVETSRSRPLEVDWLPLHQPGRLGITIAPGKHALSQRGVEVRRDLAADLDRLVGVQKVAVLVNLLEDHELVSLGIAPLVDEAARRGITVLRLPIPDGGVLPTLKPVQKLVGEIVGALHQGKNVVVHCAGGLGRSGTVAGCVLVESGVSSAEAVEMLAHARGPRCPETEPQKQFIGRYERARQAHARRRRQKPKAQTASLSRTREDAAVGAVLGAAIGDAMGHATEFMTMEQIRSKFGPKGILNFGLYWERDGRRFAPYTDDTQMAEATLRCLIRSRTDLLDLDSTMQDMAVRFVEWLKAPQGGHRAPGNACLAGCRALARGVRWSEAGGATAGGCGSVMRAFPFGLVFADDLQKAETWAVAHSKLTHRDPIALAACAAMAVGIGLIMRNEPMSLVVDEMQVAANRYSPETAVMIAQAAVDAATGIGPETTLDRLRGWSAHEAIAAAIYIVLRHPDDPRAAILEGANTPGDSDSIACIAGALVGARCGVAALPQSWIDEVERTGELRSLATDACGLHGEPPAVDQQAETRNGR